MSEEDLLELVTDVLCEVELPAPVVVSHRWLVAMLVRREVARRLELQRISVPNAA
jgi:hypothetical protein